MEFIDWQATVCKHCKAKIEVAADQEGSNASELLPFWLAAFIQHRLGGRCWFVGFRLQDVKLTPLRAQ